MSRLLSCVLLVVTVACGDDDAPPARGGPGEDPARIGDDPDALYDAQGNLRPSDATVAGLQLPRGMEEQPSTDPRVHRYWAPEVPVEKVVAYFGPRLVTGEVDRVGSGVVYRNALPRDARGGQVRMDLGIHSTPRGGARVEIREVPPPRASPPSDDELRELASELQRGE